MSYSYQLPPEIVSSIIDYIGFQPQKKQYSFCNKLLLPLLEVNNVWKNAAQKRLYHSIVLNSTDSYNSTFFNESFSIKDILQAYNSKNLLSFIRVVYIIVTEEDVCNGTNIIDDVSKMSPNLSLNNVNTLYLTVIRRDEYESELEATNIKNIFSLETIQKKNASEINVGLLVRQINNMMPNINKASIQMGSMISNISSRLGNLDNNVFDLYKSINYTSLTIMHTKFNWSIDYPLTYLNICWIAENKCCEQLIQQNAKALRTLELNFAGSKGFNDLWCIFGSDKNIAYPALTKLHLNNHMRGWTNKKSSIKVSPDYVPFPALKCLETFGNIAITDNVIFRGNNNTLLKLNLSFFVQSIGVLQSVFAENNIDKLEFVKFRIKTMDIFRRNYFIEDPEFDRLVRYLPCSLRALCFKGKPIPMVLDSVTCYSRFKCLQLLKLDDAAMSLRDICKLLKAIPNLHDLHIKSLVVENAFSNITSDQIAKDLDKEFQLSDSRINFIHLGQMANFGDLLNAQSDQVTKCQAVLTSLCPRLKLIWKNDMSTF